jgi:o-succinylbenzoate---CoA ligase
MNTRTVLLTCGTESVLHGVLPDIELARVDVVGHAGANPTRMPTRAIQATNSIAVVQDIVQCLAMRQPIALLHPRFSAAETVAATAAAGAGMVRSDDVCLIGFTSGSTATPKPIAHTLVNLWHAAHASNQRVPFHAGHRWLLSLPVCHVGGLMIVLRALVGGGTVVIPTDKQLGDAIVREQPTHVSLVPTQLLRLLANSEHTRALARCAEVLVGGAPLSTSLLHRAQTAGVRIRQTWGMTETAAQVCTSTHEAAHACGHPLPGMQVRVLPHASGRLYVRGPSLCAGMLATGAPQSVLPLVDDEGWFDTKDEATWTADGLVITGRSDRQFISGGENVNPDVVAQLLSDDRTQVWVVGVSDEEWGAIGVAFYFGIDPPADTEKRLQRCSMERLSPHQRPKHWLALPIDALPKPKQSWLQSLAEQHIRTITARGTP